MNLHVWEAAKFSFNAENQAKEWKKFHTIVIDFLEALNIDPVTPDESKCGWCQIKMMFQDEDREALQALLDNNTITPEDQLTPTCVLNAIQTTIKEDEHFWHFRDECLSDFRQETSRRHPLTSTTELHNSSTTVSLLIQLLKIH